MVEPTPERWIVLLGAGASAEAGVPMSRDMTRRMAEDLSSARPTWGGPDVLSAFRFVCGQIIAYQSRTGTDPLSEVPDVEEVFSAIELLAERRDLEVAPFVSSWLPEVEAMERLSPTRGDAFSRALDAWLNDRARGRGGLGSRRVDEALRSVVRAEVGLPGNPVYEPLLERMTLALRRLAGEADPARFSYLDPLFMLADRQTALTIATLNYDRGIELRAEHLGREIDTGIESWTRSGHFEWSAAPLHLLKLHGSVDWIWQAQGFRFNRLQRREVIVTTGATADQMPTVLFGQRGKLRAEGPFLDLLRAFAEALEMASHLAVLGYSFRDDHVNEYIRRWLSTDDSRRLVVVDPQLPPVPQAYAVKSFRDQILRLSSPIQPPQEPPPELQVSLLREPASVALVGLFG